MSAHGLDVLFVVPSLEPGGAERVVVNLANGLAGIDVTARVVTTGRLGTLAGQLAPSVTKDEIGAARVRGAALAVLRHVRRRPPDVIIATHTHLNLALCAMRPLLPRSVRLVIREPIHAPVELEGRSTRWTRLAQRSLYPRADAIIASSSELAEDLLALTRGHVVRLENPVDVVAIRRSLEQGPVAPDPAGGRSIVSIGRLTRQKAMDELIDAFAAGSGPEDQLEIIGEGPERGRLEDLIRARGLTGRVSLPGQRDDHWRRLARADGFVLASRAEGMPNAVLEALALGTPVIVTTDLTVLDELRAEVGTPMLTAVPRERLAEAIAAIPIRPQSSPAPEALPGRFELPAVVASLHAILVNVVVRGRTRCTPRPPQGSS